jgi:hypothetical protein
MADEIGEREREEEQEEKKQVSVTLGINDDPVVTKTVSAGRTVVTALKVELGVDAAVVLYLVDGKQRRLLDNSETIKVKEGMHFEAIGGGGVS